MDRRTMVKRTVSATGVILATQLPAGWACRISSVADDTDVDTTRKAGQTDVLEIVVKHTHRRCTHPIEKTKFLADGIRILGATPWEQTGSGQFSRKLKVTYLREGTVRLKVERDCERSGCTRILTYAVGHSPQNISRHER